MADCIFCGIVSGEVPAKVVGRGDGVLAFTDLNPQAPLHVQVIPTTHRRDASVLDAEDGAMLAAMVQLAREVVEAAGYDPETRGYRLVLNVGPDSLSTVPHLHCHVLAGRTFGWPPG